MVKYLRSRVQKVDEAFAIKPYHTTSEKTKDNSVPLYQMMDVGVYLLVPLLSGMVIGIMLDNKLGIKPWGILSGLLVGVIGSFFNLIYFVRQFTKNA